MDQKTISTQLIDTIRERSDLLLIASQYLSLKKTGQNYTGLCPFHEEKTASFVINPIKQFFHCFGCGVGGDVFHFVTKIEGLSFPEALRSLAERGGISLPDDVHASQGANTRSEAEEIYRVNEAAAAYFHRNLLERAEAAPARTYLRARGLTVQTITDFSIGYALSTWDDLVKTLGKQFPALILEKAGLISKRVDVSVRAQSQSVWFDRFRSRVLFPIRNPQGKIAGFGGRVLDDSMPKYLNTSETAVFSKGKILFGLHQTKGAGNSPFVIVEGYFDVMTAAQAGIPNVVATLGTALTEAHLRLIRRLSEKMVLIFDGDEAGIRAALRTVPLLMDQEISARIVSLPAGLDPDVFIREMGKDAFLDEMEKGETVIGFSITQWVKKYSLKTVEEKMKVVVQIVPLIHRLKSQIEKSHYLKSLSDALLLKEEDVRGEYRRLTKTEKRAAPKVSPVMKSPSETDRIPEDQETILMLLLQGFSHPEMLNGVLCLEDFPHPVVHRMMTHYWNQTEQRWENPGCRIEADDDSSRSLLGRLSVSEVNIEQVQQIQTDCIKMLRKKRIDRERSESENRLKQVAGDLEAEKILKKKIIDLYRESSHLTSSYLL